MKAQNYIISELKKSHVNAFQNTFQHSFIYKRSFTSKQGNNIIGYIKGKEFPERYIVLSAHYDHLGKKHQKIYNGADDNASGVAALLYFATRISQSPLKHSVIFLFTDGEEVNLLGAKAFVNQQGSLLSNVKLNMNLDMIAGSEHTRRLRFIAKDLDELLNESSLERFTFLQSKLKLKKGFRSQQARGADRRQWYEASDHSAFYHAGIPFIYFGVGTHKNYHTQNDTYDNVNLDFFIASCESIYQLLDFFDKYIE
ncbi:MAG: M28 family peptidase [Colwellia sp.]|nr:M28 family peptidase [Colwellia sp.]MCW8863433.1 M28 family peptidase [Colwellia sp.]MCW9081427.1 M28 family peptidase [Colwellia sp.]